jgi:hypothetical protein
MARPSTADAHDPPVVLLRGLAGQRESKSAPLSGIEKHRLVLACSDGQRALLFAVSVGRITRIDAIRNPAKLRGLSVRRCA